MSLGFAARQDSNRLAQLQKIAEVSKVWIDYTISTTNKKDAGAQAELHLCCSHMA